MPPNSAVRIAQALAKPHAQQVGKFFDTQKNGLANRQSVLFVLESYQIAIDQPISFHQIPITLGVHRPFEL